MNPQSSYDAVIVGARPAGASIAALLSRAGFRVLLTDRDTFPKPTLSCPLYFGNTFDHLNRLSIMDKVDAIGAPKLRWYQVQIADIHLRGQMLPYNGYDYTYHIRRELFDQLFFEHVAAQPNVDSQLGFNTTGLLWDNDRVIGIRGSRNGAAEINIYADVVIGADGVFSTVAEHAHATKYNTTPAHTCVYFAYYLNVPYAGSEPSATMYYDPFERYTFITANAHDNLTVVSMSLPASQFEWARAHRETLHWDYAQKNPALAARLEHAERVSPMYGVSPRESYYRQPYGSGWVLVGDAGYYKDPLPGQGIHDALRSTQLASDALLESQKNGASPQAWTTALSKYQTTRDRETVPMYKLTNVLADLEHENPPQLLDLFRAIAAMPDWSDRYVSLFNGVTDPAWFQRFDTPLRIFLEWRWRQLKSRLFGPAPNLIPSGVNSSPRIVP